ncbi:Uncharacterised protein [Mycobacteroides abscessus subsp. abscessus]|uniref:hypothetical protein n=1 Tax=Mycobacteroides abscessus TaxID=36809 RepID=UPI0009271D67|nr:hypothetical protein [Mycobacteroides abscessus]SIM02783.1 Uncharacterised protein [Mycobacteroides abscessus subsp. abscessus]SLC78472.1 Uncharacterised protein [Mycobacteroides abscessus subsp. abscessus]
MNAQRTSAVFIGIDGTLNVRQCESGAELLRHETGSAGGYSIHAVREVVDWLCGLHAADMELIWSTTWNEQADVYAGWFGLPRELPYLKHSGANRVSFGRSLKVAPVLDYLGAHPEIHKAVVLDDVVGEYGFENARSSGGRLLIPELAEEFGITSAVRADVDAFLGLSR